MDRRRQAVQQGPRRQGERCLALSAGRATTSCAGYVPWRWTSQPLSFYVGSIVKPSPTSAPGGDAHLPAHARGGLSRGARTPRDGAARGGPSEGARGPGVSPCLSRPAECAEAATLSCRQRQSRAHSQRPGGDIKPCRLGTAMSNLSLDTVVTRRCRAHLCVPAEGGAPSGASVHRFDAAVVSTSAAAVSAWAHHRLVPPPNCTARRRRVRLRATGQLRAHSRHEAPPDDGSRDEARSVRPSATAVLLH
jgi:hypothetical protein